MSIESIPFLFFSLDTLRFVMLAGIFAMLIMLFIFSLRSETPSSLETDKRTREAERLADEIVNHAHREALRIAKKSNEEADSILKTSHAFRTEAEKKFEKTLEEFSVREAERLSRAAQDLLAAYRTALENSKKTYLGNIDIISGMLTKEAYGGVSDLLAFLKGEIARYMKITDSEIVEARRTIARDLAAYREDKLKKINESIYKILLLVSQEVFGHALKIEEQEELVLQALEEAKKENFFNLSR